MKHVPEELARRLYWQEQRLRGRGDVYERLESLRASQWWSPTEVAESQFKALHRIVSHAYRTVPYYRRVMSEAGLTPASFADPSDLRKLPLLTRDRLRMHKDELVSSSAGLRGVITNYSSGSTGVRAEFKQDGDFRRWMRATQFRTYEWCADWKVGQPFVLLWGAEIYFNNKRWVDAFEHVLMNRREFSTFRLTKELVRSFLDELVRFRPALVSTYTNVMHLIAREAERQGVCVEGLRAIQGTSEPMPPEIRDKMAKAFGCEVYDKYGSREMGIICHESPKHEGMCVQAENVFVEFLRPDGAPAAPGEPGSLVITSLRNFAMPLIRYEMNDLAAPMAGYCSSGMGLPRMGPVAGRQQDLIVTPKGDHVDAYFFSYLIMRFPEIHWFQVVQHVESELFIRLFAPEGLGKTTRAALVERIHHHTGYPFKVEFEELTAMPPSSTGKFRLCVSELGAHSRAQAAAS